ncbi:MAG: lysostaphin resistance A-like protein [Candidatus Thorarchaeota archaeon]
MTQESISPDQEKPSIWSTMNILAISGIMLTIGIVWRIVDQFVLGLGDTWMNILPSKLFPLLIIMGFFWFYRRQEINSVLGLSLKNLRAQLAVGLVMGILVSVLIDTGGTVVYTLLLDPSYPLDLHIINGELLGYLFIFFLINAFLEEALFRGLIQNSLKTKFTPGIAITLSAVMFGLWHAGWPIVNAATGESALVEVFMIVFFTTVLGLLFGIYYEKFSSGQSLMGLVVAHTIFNFVNECFKIGPEPIMQGPDMGFATPGLMVVTLIMFFLTFSILFVVFWRYRIEQVSALWDRFNVRMRKSTTGRSS